MRAIIIGVVCGANAVSNESPNDVSVCTRPDGTQSPCAPGNQECSQFGFGPNTPQFHVRDHSCGENDPNGPVYDPVHGVYHLHYQNHVGLHGGRTYGHAVSRDFIHWAHMPISIWNDHSYDEKAIFTGSATVVDGKVVQVYPGLCDTKQKGCPGGTNLCIAVPADPSDPLQTNWTKDIYTQNPIIPATGRDPSTAWKTRTGEWRLTTFDTNIYGSMDFKTWYKIGPQPGFPRGECPSFFPMPANTPGAGPAPANAKTYTHVHKASHGGKDWMQVGTYIENGPKMNGNWSAEKETEIDVGQLYASKDFWDPVKKRRINWGWARVPPASTQTLPRVVTWNPELQQLVYSPVEEQDKLRGSIIGSLEKQTLTARKDVLLELPGQLGNQSEVFVSFARPTKATRLSVQVMVGTKAPSPAPIPYSKEMPGIDIPGGDYNVTDVDYKEFKICEEECGRDSQCQAWTYVIRGPKYASCCLKKNVRVPRKKASCTSGVKTPPSPAPSPSGAFGVEFFVEYVPPTGNIVSDVTVGSGSTTDTLKLSPNDKTIDMRLYVDNTFTEAYWMNGRVAMTIDTPATEQADVILSADKVDVTLESATVWHVNSIWVSPEQVKQTPRMGSMNIVV